MEDQLQDMSIEDLEDILERYSSVEPRGIEAVIDGKRVESVITPVSKTEKIEVFYYIYQGFDKSEIKEKVDVSESTIHNYFTQLSMHELIYEDEDSEYSLTWKGEFVLYSLESFAIMHIADDIYSTLNSDAMKEAFDKGEKGEWYEDAP